MFALALARHLIRRARVFRRTSATGGRAGERRPGVRLLRAGRRVARRVCATKGSCSADEHTISSNPGAPVRCGTTKTHFAGECIATARTATSDRTSPDHRETHDRCTPARSAQLRGSTARAHELERHSGALQLMHTHTQHSVNRVCFAGATASARGRRSRASTRGITACTPETRPARIGGVTVHARARAHIHLPSAWTRQNLDCIDVN